MAVEDAAGLRLRDLGGPSSGGEAPPRAKKAIRAALDQQRLAVREYREAVRLRPRNELVRRQLKSAALGVQHLDQLFDEPQAKPLGRFLSHYNLCIRYWDLGNAKQALKEAELACDELARANLPLGCAEHNRSAMEAAQARFGEEERQRVEAVREKPDAVKPNYDLGVLLFDKRMLKRAEAQLKFTFERVKAALALAGVEAEKLRQMGLELERPKAFQQALPVAILSELTPKLTAAESRQAKLLDLKAELEDDLSFISSLRSKWCVEEEAGKAGGLQGTAVRDGARPQLLPCLRRRFLQAGEDSCACDAWWAEIFSRTDVALHAVPSPARRRAAKPRAPTPSRGFRPPPRQPW